MKILLDMDGPMALFMDRLIERYNHVTKENISILDVKTNATSRYFKNYVLRKKIMEEPGFIYSLAPVEGAIDGVEALHNAGHEIVFVSNATNGPTSGHEKRNWLKFYFNHIWKYPPLILTKQKWHVRGDCILDDNPINFENLDPSTKPLLFSEPYNLNVSGFERINDWEHFLKWVADNKERYDIS